MEMDRVVIDFTKISRVTLVDDSRGGIQYERYGIGVWAEIQDDGQTLKLFVSH